MITAVFITIIIAIYTWYNGSVNIGEGKYGKEKWHTSKAVTGHAGAKDLSTGKISTTCSSSQKNPIVLGSPNLWNYLIAGWIFLTFLL